MSGSWSVTGAQRVGTLQNPTPDASINTGAKRSAGAARFSLSRAQDADDMRAAHAAAKTEYAKKSDKLQKTTQDFEAVFIGLMLKQMRKSVSGENALLGSSSEAKIYQDMMDDATAQRMSKTGTFGLAKVLLKTLSKTLPHDPDK